MTDEELAEEYFKTTYPAYIGYDKFTEEIKDAFIDGLKARKTKWHKIADGDYPPCEKGNYTINVLTDKGDIAYYSFNYNCWIIEPTSYEIDPPIAWCELPKFEENI